MFKTSMAAAAFAAASLTGGIANAAIFDLAFIMDESGSVGSSNYTSAMDSLADALEASLTSDVLAQDQYNITVISFSDGTTVDVSSTLVSNTTDLAGVTSDIRAATHSGGFTDYELAFDTLLAQTNALTNGAAGSIINMMTDGVPCLSGNCPVDPTTGIEGARDDLVTAGWDSLSFEAVTGAPDTDFLASLAFDTTGVGTTNVIDDPADISDPLNETFVLKVSSFGDDYDAAIASKVARIVEPDPIPVPAALPLLAGGLALFGFVGRRRRAAS